MNKNWPIVAKGIMLFILAMVMLAGIVFLWWGTWNTATLSSSMPKTVKTIAPIGNLPDNLPKEAQYFSAWPKKDKIRIGYTFRQSSEKDSIKISWETATDIDYPGLFTVPYAASSFEVKDDNLLIYWEQTSNMLINVIFSVSFSFIFSILAVYCLLGAHQTLYGRNTPAKG